jgi:hypothetical protein
MYAAAKKCQSILNLEIAKKVENYQAAVALNFVHYDAWVHLYGKNEERVRLWRCWKSLQLIEPKLRCMFSL